jgi:sodium/potassium-transporting ATPase subunit alpha
MVPGVEKQLDEPAATTDVVMDTQENALAVDMVSPKSAANMAHTTKQEDQEAEAASAKLAASQAAAKDAEVNVHISEHTWSLQKLLEFYETNPETGLSNDRASDLLATNGRNMLTPPKKTPEWQKYLWALFGDLFGDLLWGAGILCFIVYGLDSDEQSNLYLGVVLTIVVFITQTFGYIQTSKADATMDSFSKMLPPSAFVWRNGELTEINAEELVVGDIVNVKGGDKTPADLIILSADGMKVDNSSLTGESVPLTRLPGDVETGCKMVKDPNDPEKEVSPKFTEAENIAFYSTPIAEGAGKGLVIRTGDATYIGHIKQESTEVPPTPELEKEILRFVFIVAVIAFSLGILFFILSLVRGENIVTCVIFMIGIIVANVPEGLLLTVTISLTLTAKRMARKQVLVKSLKTVDTLGAVSAICSDKTGTLTMNRMSVSNIFYDCNIYRIDGSMPMKQEFDEKCEDASYSYYERVAMLCSRATFEREGGKDPEGPISTWKVIGDASEAGILRWVEGMAETRGFKSVEAFRKTHKKVAEVPFNSNNKFALSIHEFPDGFEHGTGRTGGAGQVPHLLVMKGAPDRLRKRCTEMLIEGKIVELDDEKSDSIDDAMNEFAKRGQRVLAMCMNIIYLEPGTKLDSNDDSFKDLYEKLVYVGLVSLTDPPRDEVYGAVKACSEAGIRVVMVTGDHPKTAAAIARQIGIIKEDTAMDVAERTNVPEKDIDPATVYARVVTGGELDEMMANGEEEGKQMLKDIITHNKDLCFARTEPKQKKEIVTCFKELGHVVGVTGDGVNDTPALNAANVGIAMGINGSEVAKGAADMILIDDNFASIVKGVEQGRLLFDNLKKSIAYTLTSNIPEIAPFLALIIFEIPLPLDTVHILLIDLGTDMLPAISLAYEKEESDIMKRTPRKSGVDHLVTASLIFWAYLQIGIFQALAGFMCYFNCMASNGIAFSDLGGIDIDWRDKDVHFVLNMTYDFRMDILRQCQASYLISIVIVQVANLVIAKTRIMSIFEHGMSSNKLLNWSFLEETALIMFIVYVPPLAEVFSLKGPRIEHYWPALPWFFLELIYDEVRKWWMRKYPDGLVKKYLYY